MSASDKHVLDYEGLQYFKGKIYSDLKTINGAAITGGGNLSLVVANSAITGATKCKITYDSKGLVTGGANLAASDIPSLAASKITSGTFAVDRIPALAASKITSGTFDVARIPSLAISKITDLQTTLDAKLAVKPDGTNNLIDNNKISIKYLPDVVLGQLIFGGTVTGAGVATLSTNAKTKLGTTSSSITLTNNTTAITGYKANEGIFYVVTSDGSFASLGLKTGDWLISTGDAWRKVDNTDEVTSVQIKGTANVLSSSTATAQTGAVVTTLNLVAGHGDTVNPYGNKTKNFVLAAPSMAAGAPSFRELVAADIPSLDASKITRGTFADERIASAATWNAKYSKPSTGIPASDLAESYVKTNTAITGATKCKITYDSKGLVTAGADLAASDIPSLAASKITSGTFDTARIPTLAISKISGLQSALDAKYVKPSTGIPSSDLEDTIVTSVNGHSGAIRLNSLMSHDGRANGTSPNDYNNGEGILYFHGLKQQSVINTPDSNDYAYLLGLRGWTDSSGGDAHELAFTNDGVYHRQGATTSWGSWAKLVTNKTALTRPGSPRDFGSGTLIKTDINYNVSEGNMFYLKIIGDGYGDNQINSVAKGYIYNNGLINYGVTNYGPRGFTELVALMLDSKLCFWFPRMSYWESFGVECYTPDTGDYCYNHVVSITDSSDPGGSRRYNLCTGYSQPNFQAKFAIGEDMSLIGHGNEFNFLPGSYSQDAVHINYRKVGGSQEAVVQHYYLYGGNSTKLGEILHTGNISSYATKLYQHLIRFADDSSGSYLCIYSTRSEAYTGLSQINLAHMASNGIIAAYYGNKLCYTSAFMGSNSTLYYYETNGTTNKASVIVYGIYNDTVTEL